MNDLDRFGELNTLIEQKIETSDQYDEWESLKSSIESQLEHRLSWEITCKGFETRNKELESKVKALEEELRVFNKGIIYQTQEQEIQQLKNILEQDEKVRIQAFNEIKQLKLESETKGYEIIQLKEKLEKIEKLYNEYSGRGDVGNFYLEKKIKAILKSNGEKE